MSTYKLDHIHLNSPNPAETAKFYETKLGAKIVSSGKMPSGRSSVSVDLNGLLIRIQESGGANDGSFLPVGIDHFGLKTENIDNAVSELKSNGIKFVTEARPMRTGKMAFFEGPPHMQIELLGD